MKSSLIAVVAAFSLGSMQEALRAAESPRAENSAASKRPNVLFILVDDYGIKDVGVEGSAFYETPHIDALTRGGMRFTQGYAACPVCSPSRASILLGKYPPRHGITDYIGAGGGRSLCEAAARQTVGARLRPQPAGRRHHSGRGAEAGGLSHVLRRQVAPGQQGFLAGGPRLRHQQGRLGRRQPDGRLLCPVGESQPAQRSAGANRSPCVWRARPSPSSSSTRTSRFWPTCRSTRSMGRSRPPAALEQVPRQGVPAAAPDERFKIDRTLPVRQVQDNPIYAGLIEEMDTAVGRVLTRLDELGLAENTIICFTGDNGGVTSGDSFSSSELPYRGGKGRQWEGGLRVPFYIKAPGVTRPGSTCDTPVIHTDFYPTILHLAGLPLRPEQHVDGVSLVPLLGRRQDRGPSALLALPPLRQPGRRTVVDHSQGRLETHPLLGGQPQRALPPARRHRRTARPRKAGIGAYRTAMGGTSSVAQGDRRHDSTAQSAISESVGRGAPDGRASPQGPPRNGACRLPRSRLAAGSHVVEESRACRLSLSAAASFLDGSVIAANRTYVVTATLMQNGTWVRLELEMPEAATAAIPVLGMASGILSELLGTDARGIRGVDRGNAS